MEELALLGDNGWDGSCTSSLSSSFFSSESLLRFPRYHACRSRLPLIKVEEEEDAPPRGRELVRSAGLGFAFILRLASASLVGWVGVNLSATIASFGSSGVPEEGGFFLMVWWLRQIRSGARVEGEHDVLSIGEEVVEADEVERRASPVLACPSPHEGGDGRTCKSCPTKTAGEDVERGVGVMFHFDAGSECFWWRSSLLLVVCGVVVERAFDVEDTAAGDVAEEEGHNEGGIRGSKADRHCTRGRPSQEAQGEWEQSTSS